MAASRMLAWTAAAAVFAAMIHAAAAMVGVNINSVAPSNRQGSMGGGSLLRISGSGFMRGGREGITTVFVGTEIADIIHYYSGDTMLVARTPPMSALPPREPATGPRSAWHSNDRLSTAEGFQASRC